MHAPACSPRHRSIAGFSLVEVAVAATVSALFLGSMFAANSICMNLLRNSKESACAMLSNQQRIEELRSCNWSEVTDSVYWPDTANQTSFWLTSIMNAATQSGASLNNATEVITVTENNFLQSGEASACSFQVTRNSSGVSVTSQNNPQNLVNAYMLKIDITLSWTTLGGRSRSRSSTSLMAKGGLTINDSPINPAIKW